MYNVYQIKMGDTLESIARRFNTTTEKIKELNHLDYDNLFRQDLEIIIPDSSKEYFKYYTIKKGDSIYAIAKIYNINPDLLANLNGLNNNDYIYPGQVILIPKADYSYYIIKEGDTLKGVADVFGISRDSLLNNNNIVYLLEGQLLVNKTK